MFKRKQTLPALPSPPKLEEIKDDIQNADSDDVIFTYLINSPNESRSSLRSIAANESNSKETLADGSEQDLNPEVVYDKVKRFVEENGKLDRSLLTLGELCDQLEEAGRKLDLQMSTVRHEMYNAPS